MNPSTDLDDLLHDSLHDDRHALPVAADTLEQVRRKRRTRQRLTVAGTSVGALAVVGGVLAATSVFSSPSSSLGSYSSGGVPEGSAIPSISPAYVATSGRSWILTAAEWNAYRATHTQPSPPPGQSVVASPAPLSSASAELLADVEAAGLPAGVTTRREDSVGGQPGATAVHGTFADGKPLEVFRSQLVEPTSLEQNGPGSDGDATIVAVPGTTDAAGVFPDFGYGFVSNNEKAICVMVVTRGGVMTQWVAPASVGLETLKSWAFAAAQH